MNKDKDSDVRGSTTGMVGMCKMWGELGGRWNQGMLVAEAADVDRNTQEIVERVVDAVDVVVLAQHTLAAVVGVDLVVVVGGVVGIGSFHHEVRYQ